MTNNESDSSREWASQAYALLKQKQELKKQEEQVKAEELKAEQLKAFRWSNFLHQINGS